MNIEKTIDSIPIDLFLEIFSSLPAKSVGRCRCVSKLWASILGRQDFTELFLTRSSTRPRLLFSLEQANGESIFYSSPQPQNPLEKSIVVAADCHTKFPRSRYNCSYAAGLICFPEFRISKRKGGDKVPVICNPITGQYAILPKPRTDGQPKSFLGFDPIDKQFKVLFLDNMCYNDKVHILTLGTGEMRWRTMIQYWRFIDYLALGKGVCINGVLYYLKGYEPIYNKGSYVIVCFDVRSEKFKFMEVEFSYSQLINCKGKLGAIALVHYYDGGQRIRELRMWVLEDVEKQKWSKYVYPFPKNENIKYLSVVGMTATGEIALLEECLTSKPYVFYFNPERNILQRVEIEGVDLTELKRGGTVYAFVDHVEDLSDNDAKKLKSSIFDLSANDAKELKSSIFDLWIGSFKSINKFDVLRRSDDD